MLTSTSASSQYFPSKFQQNCNCSQSYSFSQRAEDKIPAMCQHLHNFIMTIPILSSTVELGGHYSSLAASHHRIFASSEFGSPKILAASAASHHRIFVTLLPSPHHRIIASSHLRDFGSPKILIPSPHHRIIASSQYSRACSQLRLQNS